MFRKATEQDIAAAAAIYDKIHVREDAGLVTIGWQTGIYPTCKDAAMAVQRGDLYVYEQDGTVLASAIINRKQVEIYAQGHWLYPAAESEVLVLHTLCVLPSAGGRGLASDFVRFYECLAAEKGCVSLRMDTGVINSRARALYKRLGFAEVGTVMCDFNDTGRIELVLLEKPLCGGEERS